MAVTAVQPSMLRYLPSALPSVRMDRFMRQMCCLHESACSNPIPIPGVSFDVSPAPIPLAAGSTVGATTLNWSASGYSSLQIFANGTLFSDVGASGSAATGNWVSDGMNFSLVDPATNAPLSTITVHTMASSNQVTFTANPNPIVLGAAGSVVGKTTLSWNAWL